MEWSQNTLFSLLQSTRGEKLPRLGASPFGLWLRHRAQFMFEQSAAFGDVTRLVERIDETLLPLLDVPGARKDDLGARRQLRWPVERQL
ncbi:hypothetical protein ADT71_01760 [Novosphingobium sp. ST904]|nr:MULTISPECIES: hypothetical protein [unclassified Novosphingobium]KPH67910.1 hypothetical protein ADT71_01760 [Novosphingobium sp. ST904]TCM23813.1 hypothetical protein EDF59_15315 [Novosphingobium sp. ST904]